MASLEAPVFTASDFFGWCRARIRFLSPDVQRYFHSQRVYRAGRENGSAGAIRQSRGGRPRPQRERRRGLLRIQRYSCLSVSWFGTAPISIAFLPRENISEE